MPEPDQNGEGALPASVGLLLLFTVLGGPLIAFAYRSIFYGVPWFGWWTLVLAYTDYFVPAVLSALFMAGVVARVRTRSVWLLLAPICGLLAALLVDLAFAPSVVTSPFDWENYTISALMALTCILVWAAVGGG